MRSRAFSFIEIIVTLPMVALLGTCVVMIFLSIRQKYTAAVMQGDLKLEARRAVTRLFSRAATGPWDIHADQRGLTFHDGSQVRWEGDRLNFQGHSLVSHPVLSFIPIRRGDRLVVNLELQAAGRRGGPLLRRHFIYDFPRLGAE